MRTESEKHWVEEMIERESTPHKMRAQTTRDFCKERGIPESTYYFEANKKENKKHILDISLRLAKKYTPEVLENLGERATKDNKAAELFLEYVLEMKKRLDVTTNDKELPTPILANAYVSNDNSDKEDNGNEEKDKGDTGGDFSKQDDKHPPLLDSLGADGQKSNPN